MRQQQLADQAEEQQKTLKLSNDTYAMAFKAFNWNVMRQLDLRPDEIHQAFAGTLYVFGIQLLMIAFVGSVVLTGAYGFTIKLPGTTFVPDLPADATKDEITAEKLGAGITVMGARFVCTILMHLQVEGDVRQGLAMMKYVTNHPFEFMSPGTAFTIACMQFTGGLAAEFFCILYLGSIDMPVDVIIRFVALASIAKVDDIYASALPSSTRTTQKSKPLVVKVHRRDISQEIGVKDRIEHVFVFKLHRFIYKTLRIIYCSFLYYFLPYISVVLPYFVPGVLEGTA